MTENKEPRKVIKLGIEDLVEIELEEPDDFLKVRETLTRIGVSSKKDKTLFQSCHILHKQGRYFLLHFKELFALDGRPTNFDENDIARRNTIVNLLAEWDLVSLVDPNKSKEPTVSLNQIKIVSYRDKSSWDLKVKYTIGKRFD